jgi:TrwC relaxase
VALASNRWPQASGKRLTARMNRTRLDDVVDKKTGHPLTDPKTGDAQKREVSNRRAGYDFTFRVPKSVSLYVAVNEDKLVEQMMESVNLRGQSVVVCSDERSETMFYLPAPGGA